MVTARSGRAKKLEKETVGAKPQAARGLSEAAFELNVSGQVGKGHAAPLRELLPLAREHVKGALRELSVILVGDQAMAKLHWDFMRIEGPTDVMTFPIDLDAKGRPISGEVYVCVPYAQKEAKERGVKAANEVLLYAIHGMLHLCGYDDRTSREFAKMHAKEDSILKAIGVGVVFDVQARAADGGKKVKVSGKNVKTESRSSLTRSASGAAKRGKAWR